MKITGPLSIEEKTEGLISNGKIREGMQDALMTATPHPNLKHALECQMNEYNNEQEWAICEAVICLDYFKLSAMTVAAAELWCNLAKRAAADRLELIIKISKRDPDLIVKKPEKQLEVLTKSGIIRLLKNQRLTKDDIKSLCDSINENCAPLVGLGFLPERYVKKIPTKRPIKPIQTILTHIGLNWETIKTGATGGDSELDISVPFPMVSRLGLSVSLLNEKDERQALKEKALILYDGGNGYGLIAKELGLKNKDQARRLCGK